MDSLVFSGVAWLGLDYACMLPKYCSQTWLGSDACLPKRFHGHPLMAGEGGVSAILAQGVGLNQGEESRMVNIVSINIAT